jgi:REP element-mobilizing transposase RayT
MRLLASKKGKSTCLDSPLQVGGTGLLFCVAYYLIYDKHIDMPRKARIDAPGALHHIICRGIERRKIFLDDSDRDHFVQRLGRVISETQTPCYAWAIIPNHFHLLLKTGNIPIATVMRKLLTGYAVTFNRRHDRVGHLFQNRYKSILCQQDRYFLELVRYIHLNPLRANLVGSIRQLNRYEYCGHCILMGKRANDWQDTEDVLKLFGKRISSARKHYHEFVEKGVATGKRPDLTGGGLIRSAGGWRALAAFRKLKIHVKGDERILGDSNFVSSVLEEQNERLQRRYHLQTQGYDFDMVVDRVADLFHLKPVQVLSSAKQSQRVKARSLLCYWAVKELKMQGSDVAGRLEISNSAVSRAVTRGEKIAIDLKLKLIEN